MLKHLILILIAFSFVQCGKITSKFNKNDAKIDSLRATLKNNQDDTTAIVELGRILQFNGHIKEAIDLLKDAEAKFPGNAKIAIWHANAESIMAGASKDIQEKVKWSQYALADLDATVQKYNNNWYVHYMRGVNSMNWPDMFHRKLVAIEDFEFLLNYNKNNPCKISPKYLEKVHFYLGYAYYKTNQGSDKYLPQFEYIKKNFPHSQFIGTINKIINNSVPKGK